MSPQEVRILVICLVISLSLLLGLVLLIPILRNFCILQSASCTTITYQIRDNELLVDTASGLRFWFNGKNVVDYNDTVPGTSCTDAVGGVTKDDPTMIGTGTDSRLNLVTTTDSRVLKAGKGCTKYDATNKCVQTNTTAVVTGKQFPGFKIAPASDYTPRFTLDAKTMKLVDGQVTCQLDFPLLKTFFTGPVFSFKLRRNKNNSALNVFEIFDFLKRRGVFKPPS
jgi:hypothetical protein